MRPEELDDAFWDAVHAADRDALPYLALKALAELAGTSYSDTVADAISDGLYECAQEHAGRGGCDAEPSDVAREMRQSISPERALALFAGMLERRKARLASVHPLKVAAQ